MTTLRTLRATLAVSFAILVGAGIAIPHPACAQNSSDSNLNPPRTVDTTRSRSPMEPTALPKKSRGVQTPLPPSGSDLRKPAAGASPWSTFGVLAVMVVSIFAIARLWKKHGPLSTPALPSEAVETLGRRMIDQRNVIHLIRIGSRIVVVGSSPQGLATLAEVTDPVEVDVLAGLCLGRNGESAKSTSFRNLFGQTSSGREHVPQGTGAVVGAAPATNTQRPRPVPNVIRSASTAGRPEYFGGADE